MVLLPRERLGESPPAGAQAPDGTTCWRRWSPPCHGYRARHWGWFRLWISARIHLKKPVLFRYDQHPIIDKMHVQFSVKKKAIAPLASVPLLSTTLTPSPPQELGVGVLFSLFSPTGHRETSDRDRR